jgi:hypothetical protein
MSSHDCESLLRFANGNGGTERLQVSVCKRPECHSAHLQVPLRLAKVAV